VEEGRVRAGPARTGPRSWFPAWAKPGRTTLLLDGVPAKDGVDDAGVAEPVAQVDAISGNPPFRSEPKGTVTAKAASAPKSLKSGNQLTIARPATKREGTAAKVKLHPGGLYPRIGLIVTNMSRPAGNVVLYNKRGTAKQWIEDSTGRSGGRGHRAALSPPTLCVFSCMDWPRISAISC
jgi:hypothetical protein